MLEFTQGDMFASSADIRVNTVNCVGVMGAGVALAFKQRYPEMFKDYQRDCKGGRVRPGKMHVWKSLSGDWIVNFPTKRDWREPSRYEDIDAGLDDLRAYLDSVGPVTVTLPALGCGHGGLDWARVSEMIREKLKGVEAHVLVFEPIASRLAGSMVVAAPTDDERKAAEKLGYRCMEREQFPALELSTPLYVLGEQGLLSRKWIGLLPSRAPAEREIQALRAVASQLAQSENHPTVALVYATRDSEALANLLSGQGIETILLLPFGVLTRKSIAKKSTMSGSGSLTLVSAAPVNASWSRQIFAQTMELLRTNAAAMLLSDPEPDWLTSKGLGKWAEKLISYIRYETTTPRVRDTLASVGAKPIGRRGEDGAPNVDYLINVSTHGGASETKCNTAPLREQPGSAPGARLCSNDVDSSDAHAISMGELSQVMKRELFDTLLHIDLKGLDLTVWLSKNVSDTDLRRLTRLGFIRKENG
ncbi:MAG: macro domain-containing protein [Bacillota bacterium]